MTAFSNAKRIAKAPVGNANGEPDSTSTDLELGDLGVISAQFYQSNGSTDDLENLETGIVSFEAPPKASNYDGTGKARPTIAELRESERRVDIETNQEDPSQKDGSPSKATGMKFGWIRGVFVRCLLNIWGVLLFLRLSWVVAQAGLGLTIAILVVAGIVVVTTTLSMSAICTNGAVKGGGTYYLLSRSLGPEFGGAVGVIYSLANAAAIGMNTVGFAEALVDLLAGFDIRIFDFTNDVRILGVATMFLLLAIVLVGMEWEARAQLILLVVILASLVNFFVGSFLPLTDEKKAIGIVGYSATTFAENFWPAFRDGHTFMTIFGIFFPACTGIMAGANISGDLKEPSKAIPKGTLGAIGLSLLSYLLCALTVAAVAVRDATGNITDVMTGNITNCLLVCGKNDICKSSCSWGISNSYQMMAEISATAPLITTGIFAASLSSALACLVSAPKVFQALCRDNVFPGIAVFGRGFGKNDEPVFAYILAFVIGCGIVAVADLNVIAPIISNFYIGTYALINYACFDATLSSSPGFRPAFRFYNKWLSLFGAAICVACMFMINWWGALITIAVLGALWVYVHHRKPDINWGTSTQAKAFKSTVKSALNLTRVQSHVKNFRPQVLVLTGLPSSRPLLVYFANTFTKNLGMMVCGHVITGEDDLLSLKPLQEQVYKWFQEKHVKSFYTAVISTSFQQGVRSLLQAVGIGKVRPNMVLMGFTRDWMLYSAMRVHDYVQAISDAFDSNLGVGILRVQQGMDITLTDQDINADSFDLPELAATANALRPAYNRAVSSILPERKISSVVNPRRPELNRLASEMRTRKISAPLASPFRPTFHQASDGDRKISLPPVLNERFMLSRGISRTGFSSNPSLAETQEADSSNGSRADLADKFHVKAKEKIVGEIHVWWLNDDGGLTLLIPHIISKKSPWNGCKLKVFFSAGKPQEVEENREHIVNLLEKFRIESSEVVPVDVTMNAREESRKWFDELIEQLRLMDATIKAENDYEESYSPSSISNEDLEANKEKTLRKLRLRELLKEHSSSASLVVMTLPVPKKTCNPTLYMAWLETLTEAMPPILLLRGNQENVMTFYT